MARPSQNPQIRITEILDTAEPLFYANGYHATAISDIAHKMKVAQGTIYYYFKSKEEIFETLINRHLTSIISNIKKIAYSDNITPHQKVIAMVQTMFRSIHYKDALLFEFIYNDQTMHLVDKICRQGEELMSPLLLKVITEGKEQGSFNLSSPQAALHFFSGILQCLFDVTYAKPPPDLLNSHYQLSERLIAKILGTPEETIKIFIND